MGVKRQEYEFGELIGSKGVKYIEERECEEGYVRRALFLCPICSNTFENLYKMLLLVNNVCVSSNVTVG